MYYTINCFESLFIFRKSHYPIHYSNEQNLYTHPTTDSNQGMFFKSGTPTIFHKCIHFFPTIINDLGLVAIVTALHLALPKMGGIIRLIYLIQRRAARRDVMKPPQGWHHLRIDQRSP